MFQMIIADDEPAIRNGLRDLFPWKELQVEVVCLAANGRAAFDYAENHPVDLILADIRMPGMDGLELAKKIQESHPSICVVLISAYTDFEYARKAMRYGVREYITKPVDYESFLSTMRRILLELAPQEKEDAYAGYYEEIAGQVKRYIMENPASATLVGASERVGLSANYISRIFHDVLQKTFSECLLECRMETALELLKSGMKLEDAAWNVGYCSSRSFKQAFVRYFGRTPHACLTLDQEEGKPDA